MPIDQGRMQVSHLQEQLILRGNLRVQRENMQPNKFAWIVGSMENSIDDKKEPWNVLKKFHEKKKHEASGGRDTTQDSVVHFIV